MIIDFGKGPVILDGATGTLFQQKGMAAGEDSTAFAIKNPHIVKDIERQYLEAGSDLIYSPTFNLNRAKIEALGMTTEEIIGKLMAPALELKEEYAGRGRKIYISLDIGPQGEMLEPVGKLTFEDAYEFYAEQVRAGVAHGADAITIETMTDIYDVKAAVLAAKENSDLPVMVTMSFEEDGRTFTGTGLHTMALVLEGLGVDAMGINCSLGPVQILPIIRELMKYTDLPIVAKPNAGLPDPATGEYDITAAKFIEVMKDFMDEGVSMVGGCCGTTPEHIRGLAEYGREIRGRSRNLTAEQSIKDNRKRTLCLTSGQRVVKVDHVTVVGERLNPTGKKRLREALLAGDYDYLVRQAISQADAGAEILDVNVGVPGIDEPAVMREVIKRLQSVTDLPLQIDSSNHEAIEAALRVYNGKAIVNSVNGEEAVMDKVLPIVKKYGAAVIGLTLDDTGIPETCEQRFAIAERILAKAISYGIPKEDVIIDCLTLTASAQQKEVDETLKTLRRVKEELRLKTALGVSNVSFGLPLRGVVNRTFLTMALENGLDLPIIDPNDEDMMAAVFAFNVLKNRDKGATEYIARYSESDAAAKGTARAGSNGESEIVYAVERGMEAETAKAVEKLLNSMDAMAIVNEELIPALDRVGKGFETGEIFLPSMIKSAEAAQAGFEIIRKRMTAAGQQTESKGDVIIATVRGDIHDIGKNIVKVIMENYGFNMIDLGRDVPVENVVEAAKEHNIRLVGLSALMTTTLASMADTITALRAEVPDCKIMVGGAVLTADYAAEIGADYYCEDAMKSVEAAQEVFG